MRIWTMITIPFLMERATAQRLLVDSTVKPITTRMAVMMNEDDDDDGDLRCTEDLVQKA